MQWVKTTVKWNAILLFNLLQVFAKIRAKNEKINEINQELELKEDILNKVQKELKEKNVKISALQSKSQL